MSLLTREFFEREYIEKRRSLADIGKELGIKANTVMRQAKKLGFKTRTRSEAQSNYLLKTNNHPTKGKSLDKETKIKISEKVTKTWNNKTEEEKQVVREKSKKNWEERPEVVKQYMKHVAAQKVREAGVKGSKLEKYILDKLREFDIRVEFHRENLVAHEKLEVDFYLLDYQTVIEVDGPAHYLPIWGEENLLRHQKADSVKNGLLLSRGYCVVRIKHMRKGMSAKYKRDLWAKLLSVLTNIKTNFPPEQERLIMIEV